MRVQNTINIDLDLDSRFCRKNIRFKGRWVDRSGLDLVNKKTDFRSLDRPKL